MARYPGTNILRGYRKHFGVDFECALKELTLLGVTFDAQYISQLRQSLLGQQAYLRRQREARLNAEDARNEEWALFLQAMGMEFEEEYEEPSLDLLKGQGDGQE